MNKSTMDTLKALAVTIILFGLTMVSLYVAFEYHIHIAIVFYMIFYMITLFYGFKNNDLLMGKLISKFWSKE